MVKVIFAAFAVLSVGTFGLSLVQKRAQQETGVYEREYRRRVDWNLCDVQFWNNIDGYTDKGPSHLRFYNVATHNGKVVDLVVDGSLTPTDRAKIGRVGCMGAVNLATFVNLSAAATLTFSFVYAGTVQSYVVLDDFYFTIFDAFTCADNGCAAPPTPEPTASEPTASSTAPASSTTATTTCTPQSCEIYADPHISGFDNLIDQGPSDLHRRFSLIDLGSERRVLAGVKVRTFSKNPIDVNVYDTGDFWLVRSRPIHIQGRFRYSHDFVPDRSAVGAVAVGGPFLKGNKLVVGAMDGNVSYGGGFFPSNKEFEFSNGLVSIVQSANEGLDGSAQFHVEARLPMNVRLTLSRFARHVDVKIEMPPVEGMDGQCGNYNGDDEDDTEEQVGARMGELQAKGPELLFEADGCQYVPASIEFIDGFTSFAKGSHFTRSGQNTFTATTAPVSNPQDPENMSEDEKRHVVTVRYTDRHSWTVKLGVGAGPACGRSFWFGAKSALVPAITATPTTAPTNPPKGTVAPTLPADGLLQTSTAQSVMKSITAAHSEISDCARSSSCIIWGGQHVISFDVHSKRIAAHPRREAFFRTHGGRADELNVNKEGTFWLVKSAQVHVQGRYWKNKMHPEVTHLGALAISGPFLGNNTLVFRGLQGAVMWNNKEILQVFPSTLRNDFIVAKYHDRSELVRNGRTGRGIDVSLPLGVGLTVNRWKQNLEVEIRMNPQAGGQTGQCGNFNCITGDDKLSFFANVFQPLPIDETLQFPTANGKHNSNQNREATP